jgi:C-terminal processing protease CtpA/Prc
VLPMPSIKNGFTATLTEENPKQGKQCVVIARELKGKSLSGMSDQGKLTQSFDAAPFRGKRVRFAVAARTDLQGYYAQGQVLVKVSRKGSLPSFYDDLADRPILDKGWREYEIRGEIAPNAETIDLELILQGNGKVWFDAVSVEVVGRAGEGNEPPRPLEGLALENLVAFTRLLGYVRYFHPADEAAATDWDALALRGVRAVERATDPADLARKLEDLFRPVAPAVRVFPVGKPPAKLPGIIPPEGKDEFKIVYWRHFGVGTGNAQSIYYSARVNTKDPVPVGLKGEKVPKDVPPDPARPFTADLGGGISCLVPLALYGDAKGTYPRAKPLAPPRDDRPAGFFPTGNDRATRLAAVALTWNVLQHFYPYFDVVKTDWPGALRTALRAAATDGDELAFLNTLRRMIVALHDGHGRVYLRNLRFQESYRPPIQWDWVEGRLVIIHAAEGGLKPGDVVVKLDGRPAAEVLAAREELLSGATPQYRRYVALLEITLGARDSAMSLHIESPAGKTRLVNVRRTVPFNEYQEKRPEKIAELKNGVYYVDIDRITEEEFRAAVPKLAKATGIVFDLRGYPRRSGMSPISHLTDKPARSGQWHVPVVLRPDRDGMQFAFSDWSLPPLRPRFKARVAFLTDGRAISAAETFLGIIEKHHLAEIVGTPTAGTNGNINPFTVPGGYRIVWTGMKVQKQDGTLHHGVGILPTVPVSRTLRGVAEGRDEQLDRAVALVGEK